MEIPSCEVTDENSCIWNTYRIPSTDFVHRSNPSQNFSKANAYVLHILAYR